MYQDIISLLYKSAHWCIYGGVIILALISLVNRRVWKYHFKYLAIDWLLTTGFLLAGFILSHQTSGQTQVGFIYTPEVTFWMLPYLAGLHSSKPIHYVTWFFVLIYVSVSLLRPGGVGYQQLWLDIAGYLSIALTLLFALVNLTIMFKSNFLARGNLRLNSEFWFTATIFSMSFLDLVLGILTDMDFSNGRPKLFEWITIFRNYFYGVLYYGFYKGIKLLK